MQHAGHAWTGIQGIHKKGKNTWRRETMLSAAPGMRGQTTNIGLLGGNCSGHYVFISTEMSD